MYDPILLVKALAAAFLLSAIGTAISRTGRRGLKSFRSSIGTSLGLAVGFYLGCYLLDMLPKWSLKTDQDRLLLVVVPAAIAVTLASAFSSVPRWLCWTLRLAVAVGTTRVLLDRTSYLADLAGPGSREWTIEESWLILCLAAISLFTTWALLAWRERRSPSRSLPLMLAIATAGTAITLMLSGYLSGGLLGLPLSAALLGVMLGSLIQKGPADSRSALDIGIVGLFSLVVIGRFFGQLTTGHSIVLFLSPLLVWVSEWPYLRRKRHWFRELICTILVVIAMAAVIVRAKHTYDEESKPTVAPDGIMEPSLDDYLNFRP